MTVPTETLKLELTGWDVTRLHGQLAGKLAETVEELFNEKLAATVDKRVTALVDRIAEEHVRAAVLESLAGGFQPTNNYGEPTGAPVTLKERIATRLTERFAHGNYSSVTRTLVEHVLHDEVEKALRSDFGKELEAAKKRFREIFDASAQAKLAEAIRSAFGVK